MLCEGLIKIKVVKRRVETLSEEGRYPAVGVAKVDAQEIVADVAVAKVACLVLNTVGRRPSRCVRVLKCRRR